jgi:hypothetical protein
VTRAIQHHRNPSAPLSAGGALLGGAIGGVGLAVITYGLLWLRAPPDKKDVFYSDEPGPMRLIHVIAGAGTLLGSAYGAYLGAAAHQKSRAVTGALLGSSAVVLPTILINPQGAGAGMWDWIGGSVGAAIGSGIGAAGAR